MHQILHVVTLLFSLVTALETSKHVDVHAWPLSAQKSQLLASIEYNSTSAIVRSSYPPKLSSNEKIVRLGFYAPDSNTWAGIATAAENFGVEKERVVLLNLDTENEVYHVGFRATARPRTQQGESQAYLRSEVVPLNPTPEVRLNKPVVLDATGQLEQPPEKTFLQKYWWAIAGFLLLQVFLGGGAEKKE